MAIIYFWVCRLALAGDFSSTMAHHLVKEISLSERMLLTMEGPNLRGQFRVTVSPESTPLSVAEDLVSNTPALAGYEIQSVGNYVHILPRGDDHLLLDRSIELQAGRRPLSAVAAEIAQQLMDSEQGSEYPLAGVAVASGESALIDVPEGRHPLRMLLRMLRVVKPEFLSPESPSSNIAWLQTQSPTQKGLILYVVTQPDIVVSEPFVSPIVELSPVEIFEDQLREILEVPVSDDPIVNEFMIELIERRILEERARESAN